MCADRTNFFHCPAYKLMISDLKSATPKITPGTLNENGEEQEFEWLLKLTHIPDNSGRMIKLDSLIESKPFVELDLSLVWIQGNVKRIQRLTSDAEYDSLYITDDEGRSVAVLHEYLTVPGGDHPDIKLGSYVGALGQIWSNTNDVVIKAAKIMYLGDKPIVKSIWKDEVRLNKAYLAGLVLPSI